MVEGITAEAKVFRYKCNGVCLCYGGDGVVMFRADIVISYSDDSGAGICNSASSSYDWRLLLKYFIKVR